MAFSAICTHKLSHPAKAVSFINYRHEPVSFRDQQEQLVKRSGVILCCSEKSAYDPAKGARVLGGPAKQPLCSILLEYDDAEDGLYALGSYGGEMFDRFFQQFAARLQLEWGTSDVRRSVVRVGSGCADQRILSNADDVRRLTKSPQGSHRAGAFHSSSRHLHTASDLSFTVQAIN